MSWFGFALAAPVLWGMGYLMGEKVLQSGVSASALMFIYVISAIPLYWGLAVYTKTLGPSLDILISNKKILFSL